MMATRATIRRARKERGCDDCRRRIKIGERYIEHVAFPNDGDLGNERFWRSSECSTCATRYGRMEAEVAPVTAAELVGLILAGIVIATAYALAMHPLHDRPHPDDPDATEWATWRDTVPHIRALADAERAAEVAWCPASVRDEATPDA